MLKVKAGDIDISYEEVGSGKPLVLIMGFTGTAESWVPAFLDPLAAAARVITFDNRGTGGTGSGTAPFTIGQFAEDTAGLITGLGLETADVLGWSMGGFIALELAVRYPGLTGDLVLVSSYAGGEGCVPIDEAVMDRLADMSGSTRDIIARHIELLFPEKWRRDNAATVEELLSVPEVFPPLDVIDKQAAAITGWPGVGDRLSEIGNRVLLLCGTADAVVKPENSVIMAGSLPACRLIRLEGCGHAAIFQEPEKSARMIREFLD